MWSGLSKTTSRTRVVALAAVVWAVTCADPSAAPALLAGAELKCRTALASQARHYLEQIHRARIRCLRRLARGKIPPQTDCIDGLGDERVQRRSEKIVAEAQRRITSKCVGIDLTALGFPGSCPTGSGGAFTSTELEQCFFTTLNREISSLLHAAYPPPTFLNSRFRKCVDGVGRRSGAMVRATVRGRAKCLAAVDRLSLLDGDLSCHAEIPPFGPGTGMEKTDATLRRAYIQLLGGVPVVCATVNVDRLGYTDDCPDPTGGRFTTFDLKLCLFDQHRVAARSILEVAFPQQPACGDGQVGGDEECDDGNNVSGDGCTADCRREFCGDGVVQSGLGEECDNGAANSDTTPDACRSDCTLPRCGDGVVDSGEGCDPPDGSVCDDNCRPLLCGNGVVDAGEECDDGAANSDTVPDACRTDCTLPVCGDGVTDSGEACDDGNASNNDGCLTDCRANTCGDGFVNPAAEQCDDGNASNEDACLNDCTRNVCGDGFVNAGVEDCDDGNANNNDRCLNDCSLARCGDGVVCSAGACTSGPGGGPEQCDAGAGNSDSTPNACRSDCSNPRCGDGVTDTGEECDGASGSCPGGGACGDACLCANECPGIGELIVLAGDGPRCTSDDDCLAGACIDGRCRTASRLDTGMSGIAHGADVTDGVVARGRLRCGGSFPCGVCEITGLIPANNNCRCANDNRAICDEPFQPDNDDCGGEVCNCYFGPPLALSAGNTPACVVNRFSEDIFGTANVDLGEGEITTRLRSIVFTGQALTIPCPYCEGDTVPNDGVRDGVCRFGRNDGLPCDVDAFNTTFPGPDGGGHSIDCFPDLGKNVSGQGLRIELTQTTGASQLKISGDVVCGFPPLVSIPCWCMQCSGDPSVSCTSNAECEALGLGTCTSTGGASRPTGANGCSNATCVPVDETGVLGECETGPDDRFCDAIVRASGEGYISCASDADCSPVNIGIDAGQCTLVKRRACFLDPIIAQGQPDTSTPLGVSTFCIPPTSNSAINTVAGIPGPGRVFTQARSTLFCASDPTKIYTPGVGGCAE